MPFKFVDETPEEEQVGSQFKFVDTPVEELTTIPRTAPQNWMQRIPQAMGGAVQTMAGGLSAPIQQAAIRGAASPIARPALEIGGSLAGGAIGSAIAPGIGTIAGEALGYAGGKQAANVLESKLGKRPAYSAEDLNTLPGDIAEGALFSGGTRLAGKGLKYGAKAIGSVAKPLIGKLTGAGTGAVEEALESGKALKGNIFKSQTPFDKALRGEMSGEEVVENARGALSNIKEARSKEYISQLEKITANKKSFDISPIKKSTVDLLKKFVPQDSKGNLLWDRMAIGKEGSTAVKEIKEIANMIKDWGSKEGDRTVKGLDALKRQLDDFYSDSSKARAFVADLKNSVKDLIVENVPKYAEMSKNYAKATTLIKDLEAGLMLRKQGMSGRVVSDQTLRRLVSSMKENFPLRKELVGMLSQKGGRDVTGAVAGHAMSPILPRGLAGTGPAIVIEAALTHLNPGFAGLLAASSPRVMGEFLRVFGKGLAESGKISPVAARALSYYTAKKSRPELDKALKQLDPATSASAEEVKLPLKYNENMPSQRVDTAFSSPGTATSAPVASPAAETVIKGTQAYQQGDYEGAINFFKKAMKEDPSRKKYYIASIDQILSEKKAFEQREDPELRKARTYADTFGQISNRLTSIKGMYE